VSTLVWGSPPVAVLDRLFYFGTATPVEISSMLQWSRRKTDDHIRDQVRAGHAAQVVSLDGDLVTRKTPSGMAKVYKITQHGETALRIAINNQGRTR
jgi:hypothetical protein